jgi:hypothetical protein
MHKYQHKVTRTTDIGKQQGLPPETKEINICTVPDKDFKTTTLNSVNHSKREMNNKQNSETKIKAKL